MIPAFCFLYGHTYPLLFILVFLAQYALLWVFEYFPANRPFVLA